MATEYSYIWVYYNYVDISQWWFSIGGSTFQAILSGSAVNMIVCKSFESDFLDQIYSNRITGSENINFLKAL